MFLKSILSFLLHIFFSVFFPQTNNNNNERASDSQYLSANTQQRKHFSHFCRAGVIMIFSYPISLLIPNEWEDESPEITTATTPETKTMKIANKSKYFMRYFYTFCVHSFVHRHWRYDLSHTQLQPMHKL